MDGYVYETRVISPNQYINRDLALLASNWGIAWDGAGASWKS